LEGYPAAQITAAAVVGGTVSDATGGKFANGAVTAAMAYAFNSMSNTGRGTGGAGQPDFDGMSNQEIADWMKANASKIGVELSSDVSVLAVDGYVDEFGRPCSDAFCGGRLLKPVAGSYLDGVIKLYRPAFEDGLVEYWRPDSSLEGGVGVVAIRVNRTENAVFNFGHEAAHSRGIDLHPGLQAHPNADAAGLDALRAFRAKFCGGERC